MGILRRLGLGLTLSLLPLLLLVFALFMSVYAVLDRPLALKDALRQSGLYSIVTEHTVERKQAENPGLPLENEIIRRAIADAFPATYIQTANEHLIDNTYDWIKGTARTLDLTVDLAAPKQAFADSLAAAARQKLTDLPSCTQFVAVPRTLDGLLGLSCRPPGVSTDQIVNTVHQKALESNVFNEIAFRPETITNTSGETLNDTLSFVPAAYRYFIFSLFIIPVLIGLCVWAIVGWSLTRRDGVKRLSRILLGAGIAACLFGIVLVWGIEQLIKILSDSSSAIFALQQKILAVANILTGKLRIWWIGSGLIYFLGAVGIYIGLRIRDRGALHKAEALNESLGYNEATPAAGTTFDPSRRPRSGLRSNDPRKR